MGQKISSEALKSYLQGKSTPLEILNQKPGKQHLEIIRNNGQIIVKGDFEMEDDLVFHVHKKVNIKMMTLLLKM